MYKEELDNIEKELAEVDSVQDEDLLKELQALEKQEKDLDKGLEDIKKQEQSQAKMLRNLRKSKDRIHAQEEEIWMKMNDYERELSNQQEQNK